MITELKPYDEYKQVDLPWLRSVPSHWDMTRNKNVLNLKKDTVGESHTQYTLLSLTKIGIIARDMINPKGKFPKDFDTYQIVNPKNVVFCLFDIDETPRTVGISHLQGMITGAYTVFKTKDINQKYLYYYYLSLDNHKQLKPLYTGLRKVINTDSFLRIKMPYPPRDEQDQIVRYLDSTLAKINKFIKTKKKLIGVLKEQKQAIINKAVTKGLDPNVKMKQSGIEWLGDIPINWEARKMKYLGRFINGYAFPSDKFKSSGVRVMKISNIQTMNIDWTDESFIDESYYWELPTFRVLKGDLVLSLTRPIISTGIKAAFVYSDDKILLNQRNALFRAGDKLSLSWLYYVIFNSNFTKAFDDKIDKTGQQPNISTFDIQNISIPLPRLVEQQEIVKYLETKVNAIDKSISSTEQEIALMTEFRTRLISDVVTGKGDIRGIAVDEVIEVLEDLNVELLDDESLSDEDGDENAN